jgi:polyhydroxybutyrate depolymerase
MKRVVRGALTGLLLLTLLGGGLFYYFLYTPKPDVPSFSGQFAHRELTVGGIPRSYLTYRPADLPADAPILVVLHGSDGDANTIRRETGYAFERLADRRHIALVFPEAFEGNWNACNRVGDYAANVRDIDDVGFVTRVTEAVTAELGATPRRVFVAGVSRGGQLALRLAIEAPSRFVAVAAIAASLPAPGNFKCHASTGGTSSVLFLNGTDDPLNPFGGGEVALFGMFRRGEVRSSQASAQYFADANHIGGSPASTSVSAAGGIVADRTIWRAGHQPIVALLAVRGGGHSLPQPYARAPRLLGSTVNSFDGAEAIWAFFEAATSAP